ncbi:MAG TPA: undecaprenyl-diphosphate phosphatase [Bacteroidetes bacterium]|nr:undecaprenyl-diphosphate phosphatase [Bacteroidota bacterium]
MSELIKSIILGIIQGLTEFLPVSSSGHLELAKHFLGTNFVGTESLTMSVILHIATALSTVFVFRKEIWDLLKGIFAKSWNDEKEFAIKILISMIPAGLIGYLLESRLEKLFEGKVVFVAFMLIITGLLLLFSDYVKNKSRDINYKDSFIIGIAQAVALLPGISRSGSTISTSLLLGIKKEKAAFFSFIMVIPLIFGKMAKDIIDGVYVHSDIAASSMIAGGISAFVVGVFACKWMVVLVKNSKLRYFAYYCFSVALISLIIFLF